MLERYARELRLVAHRFGVDLEAVPDNRVVDMVARRLRDSESRSLWVVDDVPDGVDAAALDFLLLPTYCGARTILIGNEDVFRDQLPVVRVGPLPMLDAAALLDCYRSPDDDADRDARDEIVLDLGGNAAALVAVGEHLQDRHSLSSYLSLFPEIDALGQVTDGIFASVRRVLDRMSPDELTLLRLADRSGTGVFPASLLAALPSLAAIDVGAALKRLLARSAASRVGAVWRLDPLVVRAARDHPRLRGMQQIPISGVGDASRAT